MQAQLTGQAGNLFSGITGDAGQAGQDIYNQIRAIQNPQEQRDQLRLNEEMFARGRGGISSAQYGGQGARTVWFQPSTTGSNESSSFPSTSNGVR